MLDRERIVVDTNCLISRLLLPASVPGKAVRKAIDSGLLVVSEATMNELADVLARPKFDRYISLQDRQQFLRLLGRVAEFVHGDQYAQCGDECEHILRDLHASTIPKMCPV